MIAAIAAWWKRRRVARCAAGKHQWRHISDRVYCKACRRWWHGMDPLAGSSGSSSGATT